MAALKGTRVCIFVHVASFLGLWPLFLPPALGMEPLGHPEVPSQEPSLVPARRGSPGRQQVALTALPPARVTAPVPAGDTGPVTRGTHME